MRICPGAPGAVNCSASSFRADCAAGVSNGSVPSVSSTKPIGPLGTTRPAWMRNGAGGGADGVAGMTAGRGSSVTWTGVGCPGVTMAVTDCGWKPGALTSSCTWLVAGGAATATRRSTVTVRVKLRGAGRPSPAPGAHRTAR